MFEGVDIVSNLFSLLFALGGALACRTFRVLIRKAANERCSSRRQLQVGALGIIYCICRCCILSQEKTICRKKKGSVLQFVILILELHFISMTVDPIAFFFYSIGRPIAQCTALSCSSGILITPISVGVP